MNLIPGVVRYRNAVKQVDLGPGVWLPLPLGTRAEDGQYVLYGVRPEHCAVRESGLPVEIAIVEPTGADTQIYGRVNGHSIVATLRDRTDLKAGERIFIVPGITRAHLFDEASGARLHD